VKFFTDVAYGRTDVHWWNSFQYGAYVTRFQGDFAVFLCAGYENVNENYI